MNTCRTCDYSEPIDGDADGLLECRRHAIRAIGLDDDGDLISAFPTCEPSMWCGDFAYTAKLNLCLDAN